MELEETPVHFNVLIPLSCCFWAAYECVHTQCYSSATTSRSAWVQGGGRCWPRWMSSTWGQIYKSSCFITGMLPGAVASSASYGYSRHLRLFSSDDESLLGYLPLGYSITWEQAVVKSTFPRDAALAGSRPILWFTRPEIIKTSSRQLRIFKVQRLRWGSPVSESFRRRVCLQEALLPMSSEVRVACVLVKFFQASWKHQPCLAQRLDDKKALNP